MPLLPDPPYLPPFWFRESHMNTAVPALFRRVTGMPPVRPERVELHDGDFVDLHRLDRPESDRLMLALPGMGGFAIRPYMRGMLKHFYQNDWNAVGLNYRGAAEHLNRKVSSYHMGSTEDVHEVLQYLVAQRPWQTIVLVGFSMGGNLVLKYFGEGRTDIPAAAKTGVAFAVPSDIPATNDQLNKGLNKLYVLHFIDLLYRKLRQKRHMHPDFNPPWLMPFDFKTFDDKYTGPLHGYRDAQHYWSSVNAAQFIPRLDRPVLLVNSRDDSFLPPAAYPVDLANESAQLYFERTDYGGHCGFVTKKLSGPHPYWSEERALRWAMRYV